MIRTSSRIAVIGAGAAGLASAREAIGERLDVVVFESADRVGGVWVYRDEVEDDPLGLNASRSVHGSLYASLRTNLPREVMAFRENPFGDSRPDNRQFPSHERVLEYLEDFADSHDLDEKIRFNTPVQRVEPTGEGKWQVTTNKTETFDAVMICNGHYFKPRVPDVQGMEEFPGLLMHSHNYRTPTAFAGKRVVLFGNGASGVDLSLEISSVAERVFWCATEFRDEPASNEAVRKHAEPVLLTSDGGVCLRDGTLLQDIDIVLFCTGYDYAFPFLAPGIVEVEENWVHPLFRDLIPPAHPTIAFIGLPLKIVPFPLFEMQARWFLRRIAGRYPFPSRKEMEQQVEDHRRELLDEGRQLRHFHLLGNRQFGYVNRLASECGAEPLPDWFEPMVRKSEALRRKSPETYRDQAITAAVSVES